MNDVFPEFVCPYAKRLAAASPRFARQCYDRLFAQSSIPSIEQSNNRIVEQSNSRTVEQSNSRTVEQSNNRTVEQSNNRTIEQSNIRTFEPFSPDPFGELTHASKCFGLKQRFPDRVLVMTSDRCFMNCRHCTRRGLLGKSQVVRTAAELAGCVDYVKAHPKVRDVLLSGGDILTLPDAEVLRFVTAFAALSQVELVRVCTRALATNPGRVTDRLARALARSKKVWVNTQFNCADEVTDEARDAAAKLVDRGVPVSCQTVLLRGVNDSGPEMLKLLKALSAARIRPYYVFQCDPVAGIGHFRVPLEKARQIELYCAERIGGLALPRFVADLPGAKRKTPISELP